MTNEPGAVLDKCRERFGRAPRELDADEQAYCRLQPSFFMRLVFFLTFDKLRLVTRDQERLRDHGWVVWGALVQANEVLFNPSNRQTLPANVIYSTDAFYDDEPDLLQDLASGLFELKGTDPDDEELERFANAVTDELARNMKLRLPASICEGRKVYFTTCLIHPPHLPGGYLAQGVFPLLICPEQTDAVMILPSRYWPRDLRERWMSDE